MKDVYISGSTDRVSPEAPVPIVKVIKTDFKAGGAGNVAINVAALGLKVTLLSLIGNDESANEIEKLLSSHGVNCVFVKSSKISTIEKHRIISQNQQIIRLDYESNNIETNLSKKNYSDLLNIYKKKIHSKKYSAVIISDYKKGVLKQCKSLITYARQSRLPIFVDPKGKEFFIYEGATFIKPNLKEFENIVGPTTSKNDFDAKAKNLKNMLKVESLLITKGRDGMTLYHQNQMPLDVPATNSKEVFDVTGAGDTVLAVVAAGYVSGFTIYDSVKIANASAGIVVSKFGTASINSDELVKTFEYFSRLKSVNNKIMKSPKKSDVIDKIMLNKVITNKSQLDVLLEYIEQNKINLIFTNGCFDILHAGHIHLFQESRKFGDLLLVAINEDESVSKLKGASRPVNRVKNRIEVLKSIQFVDFIIAFREETPANLIKQIKPFCLVKGGDYKNKTIIGSDFVRSYGGKVETIPLIKNLSTTGIIKNIK